jgi:hypothetical protein
MAEDQPSEPEGIKRLNATDDDDTEGHRKGVPFAEEPGGPEGIKRIPFVADDDTEGHMKSKP